MSYSDILQITNGTHLVDVFLMININLSIHFLQVFFTVCCIDVFATGLQIAVILL